MLILEEDPEMYAAAGLPIPTSNPIDLEATFKLVTRSAPDMKGANVNIKLLSLAIMLQ
jgi:hypothetical protein